MATAYVTTPILRIKRSTQSGEKVMTAAYSVVYETSSPYAYLFASAEIDLSNMQAGDVVDIRVRKKVEENGSYIVHDERTYSGVQPSSRKSIKIGPLVDVYGVEIAMRQTAGAFRTFYCEFFDAKR